MAIERNQFTKEWLDAGRAAGFTDAQLEYLWKYHGPEEITY